MDQGLKERLVGGAVLVVIAAWLIPWVLDGPEEGAEAPASALQLPSAEEPMPMRTQTLKLGDVPEPSSGSAATSPTSAPPAEIRPAPVEPLKASAEPRADAGPDARGGAAAEPAGEQTVAAATRAPERAPPPKAAPTAAGDWAVQLGSFEDEGNAKRMAQRAGTFGYKAEVSSDRGGGRMLYRVRVGPQATKASADAVASALRAHGVEARVVAAR